MSLKPFAEFSEAFDKFPHDRLLKNLGELNFRSSLLLCIGDFLTGRSFSFGFLQSMGGVPQGFLLRSLLLFILIIFHHYPNLLV